MSAPEATSEGLEERVEELGGNGAEMESESTEGGTEPAPEGPSPDVVVPQSTSVPEVKAESDPEATVPEESLVPEEAVVSDSEIARADEGLVAEPDAEPEAGLVPESFAQKGPGLMFGGDEKPQRDDESSVTGSLNSSNFLSSDMGGNSENNRSNNESKKEIGGGKCNGTIQVVALLHKNLLTKYRNPFETLLEIFSPVMVMLIVVFAHQLSDVYYSSAREYTTMKFEFPGPWLDLVDTAFDQLGILQTNEEYYARKNARRYAMFNRRALFEDDEEGEGGIFGDDSKLGQMKDFQHFMNEWRFGVEDDSVKLPWEESLESAEDFPTFGRVLFQEFDDEDVEIARAQREKELFTMLDEARRAINTLLRNPLPVPSFRSFVGMSKAISSVISEDALPRVLSESSYGRQWGNLLTLGTLHLSPSDGSGNSKAEQFYKYLNETYPVLMQGVGMKIRLHETEEDGIRFINENIGERTWALIDFSPTSNEPTPGTSSTTHAASSRQLSSRSRSKSSSDSSSSDSSSSDVGDILLVAEEDDQFAYKIRMNATTLPSTHLITNIVNIGLNSKYQTYYMSGYLTLQKTINEFAFKRFTDCGGDGDSPLTAPFATLKNLTKEYDEMLWSMPMPTPKYEQNLFYLTVGYLLGMTMVMAYFYPTSRLIKSIVEEKETKMKETMFIMGVRPWAHYLSWIITAFATFFLVSFFATWLLTKEVFLYSNKVYIFIFLSLFGTSSAGFCFTVAAFFSRAKLAAIVGPILFFITLLPRYIFFDTTRFEAICAKKWTSLLPASAFSFGADILADYEYNEQGIQTWNADLDAYSFNTSLRFLFLDTLLYLFLGWYLDKVVPRQYGAARPWYFLCTPKYWRECLGIQGKHYDDSSDALPAAEVEGTKKAVVEHVSDPALTPRVFIKNLVKQYNSKKNKKKIPPAVNNLSLELYESEITCLLGHNGAGKTSTVSVLTGLFPPTSGDCKIYDNSIVHDLIKARESIGICPQQNILFDKLTVLEHIAFFQRIKGIKPTHDGIREKANEIGLHDYLKSSAATLSGGNKRKLCVAIALCGDPKCLILDEPTSAMDPSSRRACWDVLRRKRLGRVTLLTTHFMDEAELLSDRVAVVKEGVLQCYGSGLFLKDHFGLGWNLTVVLGKASAHDGNHSNEKIEGGGIAGKLGSPSDRIITFLRSYIPETELVHRAGRELIYRFPNGSEHLFPATFDALEHDSAALGISTYGVENASLEELFLLLAEEEKGKEQSVTPNTDMAAEPAVLGLESQTDAASSVSTSDMVAAGAGAEAAISNYTRVVSSEEYRQLSPLAQIGLLIKKRWTVQKRDKKGAFFMIGLPVLCVAIVLILLSVRIPFTGPPIEVNPDLYSSLGETEVIIGGGASFDGDAAAAAVMEKELYQELSEPLQAEYSEVKTTYLKQAATSAEISHHLLETYNDHNHSVRYGAYAFDDFIPVRMDLNWWDVRKWIIRTTDKSVDYLIGGKRFDLFEELGIGEGSDPLFIFNMTVADIADEFYKTTPFSADMRLSIPELQRYTSAAVSNMISTSSDVIEAKAWEYSLRDLLTKKPNYNKTEINIELFANNFFDNVRQNSQGYDNVELEHSIGEFIDEFYMDMSKAVRDDLDETGISTRVEALIEGLVNDVNNLVDKNITTPGLRDIVVDKLNGDDFYQNATKFLEELRKTNPMDRVEDCSWPEEIKKFVDKITSEEFHERITRFIRKKSNEKIKYLLNITDLESNVESMEEDVRSFLDEDVRQYIETMEEDIRTFLEEDSRIFVEDLVERIVRYDMDVEEMGNYVHDISDTMRYYFHNKDALKSDVKKYIKNYRQYIQEDGELKEWVDNFFSFVRERNEDAVDYEREIRESIDNFYTHIRQAVRESYDEADLDDRVEKLVNDLTAHISDITPKNLTTPDFRDMVVSTLRGSEFYQNATIFLSNIRDRRPAPKHEEYFNELLSNFSERFNTTDYDNYIIGELVDELVEMWSSNSSIVDVFNNFVDEVREVMDDFRNLTLTDFENLNEVYDKWEHKNYSAVLSTVEYLMDKATDFVEERKEERQQKREKMQETIERFKHKYIPSDDLFDRSDVEKTLADLLVMASKMLDIRVDDAETKVNHGLEILDKIVSKCNENNATVPAGVLVASLILADTSLQQALKIDGATKTFTFNDAFGVISEKFGGSKTLLDGYFLFEAGSVILDGESRSLEIARIHMETGSTVLVDNYERTFVMPDIEKFFWFIPTKYIHAEYKIKTPISTLHNTSSPHGVAAFSQAYMEQIYKECKGDDRSRLISINHPLPLTNQQGIEVKVVLSVLSSLFILVPYCYIPAAFVVFLVKERSCKSKHVQIVSGVNLSAYWLSTYIWDTILFFILTVLIMLVYLMYGTESAEIFVGSVEAFFCTFLLTFGYGLSILPFAYLFSRGYESHSSAQVAVGGIVFMTGFVAVNAHFTLGSLEETAAIANGLYPIFRMWPAFNVGEGLINLSASFWYREVLGQEKYPFDWDVAGQSLCLLYVLAPAYFLLLLVLEYSHEGGSGGVIGRVLRAMRQGWQNVVSRWYGLRRDENGALLLDDGLDEGALAEDEDVAQERAYVEGHVDELRRTASVLIVNLWKVYQPSVGLFGSLVRRCMSCLCCGRKSREDDEDEKEKTFKPKRAVRGINTAIVEGETYALLGANGAGKTTTLGMLSGDIAPSRGNAYVAGHDITGNGIGEARKNIGFCPQVDPLLDLMTGREILTMFAKLRGIPAEKLTECVDELLERLTLTPHADKVSKAYSGGNKRKLSLGVALIGDPKVLLIDESSSGLDPVARRRMWDLIEDASKTRSVILTTHSMQEAEALATRVCIMAKGEFLCLGSVQHLKRKYLDGYTIDVFCRSGTPQTVVDMVVSEVTNIILPGSRLTESHGRFLRFDVSDVSSMGLGTCFRGLQELCENASLCVENYSISQCSLEQVFVKLVSAAESAQNDEQPEPELPETMASF